MKPELVAVFLAMRGAMLEAHQLIDDEYPSEHKRAKPIMDNLESSIRTIDMIVYPPLMVPSNFDTNMVPGSVKYMKI